MKCRLHARCLIVDTGSSSPAASAAEQALKVQGFDVRSVCAAAARLDIIEDDGVVLVTFDATAPALGVQLCRRIGLVKPCWPKIALIDGGQGSAMVDALAVGAFDFIAFPCSGGEIVARVRRALGQVPSLSAAEPAAPHPRLKGFIGSSPGITRPLSQIPLIASCDAGLLILGETGTGKEVFAQAVHYMSARAPKPWVAVNCGAMPVELIESELFGHVKGAFTTAHCARRGLVPEAEGGTLFLDDVDCLPLAAQAKLLRFLQELEFRPVGSNRVMHADVRVIASSNRSLAQLSVQGTFRQDLYYRLNVLTVTLPPLRERRDDIGLLAQHFAIAAGRKFSRAVPAIAPEALRKLLRHDWPGNVRELQHVVERAVLMATGGLVRESDLDIDDPPGATAPASSFRAAKAQVVEAFERSFIEDLLTACVGNVSHAARRAGKDRRAFFELMRKHAIEPQRFRVRP